MKVEDKLKEKPKFLHIDELAMELQIRALLKMRYQVKPDEYKQRMNEYKTKLKEIKKELKRTT